MSRRRNKDEQDQYSANKKDNGDWQEPGSRNGKAGEEYKCGKGSCGKIYHSYTAFYNHCKKNHNGQFPKQSLINGKTFEGPSKNRGRPRIKKNDTKDEAQIQSMKTQNQLIEFLGTLKSKKNQQLVVYVESPIDRVEESLAIARDWNNQQPYKEYYDEISTFNKVAANNDLPEFYDPIEIDLYKDKLDSYNFNSIYTFMIDKDKREKHHITDQGKPLLRKILVTWLARFLSDKLLSQVIYAIAQIHMKEVNAKDDKLIEKELLASGKSAAFNKIVDRFFDCFLSEQKESEERGQSKNNKLKEQND